MSRWRTIDALDLPARWSEPMRVAAVYAVYADDELIYIGQSTNLLLRLNSHIISVGFGGSINTRWGWFRNVRIKYREGKRYGEWAMSELRLIRRLKPCMNIRHRGTDGK